MEFWSKATWQKAIAAWQEGAIITVMESYRNPLRQDGFVLTPEGLTKQWGIQKDVPEICKTCKYCVPSQYWQYCCELGLKPNHAGFGFTADDGKCGDYSEAAQKEVTRGYGRTNSDFDEKMLNEYSIARAKFSPMNGPHEGYAVLKEEVDELWDAVKSNDTEQAKAEAIQVAAMAMAFWLEV